MFQRFRHKRLFAVAQAAAMFALLSAGDCSETSASSNPDVIARKFDPASGSYVSFVGDTVAIVTAVWSTGAGSLTGEQEITDAKITWTSSNPGVAVQVEPLGSFTGYRQHKGVFKVVGLGTTTVTGTLSDDRIPTENGQPLKYTATITAVAGQPVTLTWSQTALTLNVGEEVTVTPEVRTASGTLLTSLRLDVSCTGQQIAGIAYPGFNPGCRIPDGTESPIAFALLPGTPLKVRALAPGSATFTLRGSDYENGRMLGSQSSTLNVTVRAPGVATTLTVSADPPSTPPNASTINIGATRQLRAVVKNQYGETMPNEPVTWSTSNGSFATVSNDGLVKGMAAGSVTITARAASNSSVSGTYSITVQSAAPTVNEIHIAPSYISWGTGPLPTPFIYALWAADGTELTDMFQATWSSSNTSVATVDQQGNVTGLSAGGALITVSAGGKSMSGAVSIGARGSIRVEAYLGTVAGGVAAYGATLTATQGTTTVGTGVINQTGEGYIPGLQPGTYTVTVSRPGYATRTITGVNVVINTATQTTPIALTPQ